ncbi:JmjC domain-containing protein [Streptomyces sp. NBC_01207]|uniref:JmjC domain-containing protein n=1 Tax=Streptomyces sp. NBC_01207 TaxID=2903772 RepID=UPI002E1133CF|nr:cupin domain-containing protein [Streptomyces sp. NBC_01207]
MQLSDIVEDPAALLAAWPVEPIQWQHAPDHFDGLLTMGEVNEWVDSECLPLRNLELVEDGRLMERHEYQGNKGMPDPGRVRAHLAAGQTVSIRRLETAKPSVSRLARGIQELTGYDVQINAYVTPGGRQGFRYHYDPYATLILQVHGSKVWHVHPPVVENPTLEHGDFQQRGFTPEEQEHLAVTPPAASYVLDRGTAFWLPRGFIHAPIAEPGETSVHLTIAIRERTRHWVAARLATEILNLALTDPALRSVVPPVEMAAGPADVVGRMRAYLVGALLQLDPAEMAELTRRAAVRPA